MEDKDRESADASAGTNSVSVDDAETPDHNLISTSGASSSITSSSSDVDMDRHTVASPEMSEHARKFARQHDKLVMGGAGNYWGGNGLSGSRKRKTTAAFSNEVRFVAPKLRVAKDTSKTSNSESSINPPRTPKRTPQQRQQQHHQHHHHHHQRCVVHGLWCGINVDAVDKITPTGPVWFPATVLQVQADRVQIHFHGWSPLYDKWISLKDICKSIRLSPSNMKNVDSKDLNVCVCTKVLPTRGKGTKHITCCECRQRYHKECVGVSKQVAIVWEQSQHGYSCFKCSPPFGRKVAGANLNSNSHSNNNNIGKATYASLTSTSTPTSTLTSTPTSTSTSTTSSSTTLIHTKKNGKRKALPATHATTTTTKNNTNNNNNNNNGGRNSTTITTTAATAIRKVKKPNTPTTTKKNTRVEKETCNHTVEN